MRLRASKVIPLTGMFFVCLLGCGGAETASVSGEVSVDGNPLEKGVISFIAIDGNGAPMSAAIENGKYYLQTSPGNKRVEISAPVVTGKRKEYASRDAPMVEITSESLPPRYHTKSELTFDVQSGSNTKDWSVESKMRKP